MKSINFIDAKNIFFKLVLMAAVLFVYGCSNDERLDGYRQTIIDKQSIYETSKIKSKLVLDRPRNVSTWSHGGSSSNHNLGNIAFGETKEFNSYIRAKIGPKGRYSEPIAQDKRIFILTPNGYLVVYNTKGQFLWELSILPEGTKLKNNIYGGLAISKDNLVVTSSLGELLLVNTSKKKLLGDTILNDPSDHLLLSIKDMFLL